MRAALLGLALGLWAAPAAACSLALVLALDISRSVNSREYEIQIGGLAAALRDAEIRAAIRSAAPVWVTVYEWSGMTQQHDVAGWTRLATTADIDALAGRLDAHRRSFDASATAIGRALAYGLSRFDALPEPCARRVIDVSGDGANNAGRIALRWHPEVDRRGVTVNALVIKGAFPDPETHYRYNVIRGPGSFLMVARNGFTDYPELIKGKLLRELRPDMLIGRARD